eukprot:CAMPEP_0168347586 /NCGR_PEP_ID=MMETSP0213-20121227/19102_1 /TAXON_ID=151035 /ORGANISM="Euplotes harpa, Strain FSP1.4" /LENGTH=73 /DNA_ID=CAMNT_0008356751 /DNA_START=1029 /DNA_END=1250 /DNA_ORIENTATION=+
MMGITSGIYAAMVYPMIQIVIKPDSLGTAYGINSSLLNLSYAFGPFVVGSLTFNEHKENAYFWVNVVLGFFSS